MGEQRPRGRRAGGEGARDDVLQAARAEFGALGYEQTTLRGVARRAGVDPALVRYYFPGGKPELLAGALSALEVDPRQVIGEILAPGVDGLGTRLALRALELWDAPGGGERYRLIFAATANGEQGTLVRDFLAEELFGRVAAALTGPDTAVRAGLVFSHMLGVMVARYVLRFEPVASAPAPELAARIGPVLQRYLDPPGPLGLAEEPGPEHYFSHGE